MSAPSSFIVDAHSKLYTFYTGEKATCQKSSPPPLWICHFTLTQE